MLQEILEIVRDLAKAPPAWSARTLGELLRSPSTMRSLADLDILYSAWQYPDHAPVGGRAGLIEALKRFIADIPEARRVAAIEAFLAPPALPKTRQTDTTTP
jgi:hypothetical protein